MRVRLKRLAQKVATSYPIYRVMPGGPLRTYAELRYHNSRSSKRDVIAVARTGRASRHLSTGIIAAKAAFRTGQDDLVDELLAELVDRFPHAPAVFELRAELREYRGEYAEALADAERARLLEPSRPTATAKVVRLTYRVKDHETADEVALAALRRMPLNQSVLWAVCKCCYTEEQAKRILGTWREAVPDHSQLPKAVWQLATAAARGHLADDACELYREAIIALHANPGIVKAAAPRVLEGKGAWSAIEDITDVLDRAGIPFFFAAGTALGLVREGRPLALDGDIDVGVFEADWDRDAFVELFRYDPRFTLDPNPMSKKVGLKHRGGSPIDIFRYYEEDGKVWHDGVFVRWDNSPFVVERQEINGLVLPVPADADRYLAENYGDWRTPNPEYDVFTEAPNFHVHWPEYARMHMLRHAFRALRAGDHDAAIADLKAAGEVQLATQLKAAGVSHGESPKVDDGEPTGEPPAVQDVLNRARTLVAAGQHGQAWDEIDSAIRQGYWGRSELWDELAALATSGDDCRAVQRLWHDAPERTTRNVKVIRAVARVLAAAGSHDEAQALLSRAIMLSVRRARRPCRTRRTSGS
jgi:tetratricopeptide (TPR) repeat protein